MVVAMTTKMGGAVLRLSLKPMPRALSALSVSPRHHLQGMCSSGSNHSGTRTTTAARPYSNHHHLHHACEGHLQTHKQRLSLRGVECGGWWSQSSLSARRGGARSMSSSPFCRSQPAWAVHTMSVPGMGDSISEGTVVEWLKKEGDSVAVDDVVCVMETDKVSIDIRAEHGGTVTKHFAQVDAVIAVGAPLCQIDDTDAGTSTTEGDAAAKAAPPPSPSSSSSSSGQPASSAPIPPADDAPPPVTRGGAGAGEEEPKKRVPLIKFLGKRSLLSKQQQLQQALSGGASQSEVKEIKHTPGALDITEVVGGPLFGRAVMTEEEMLAIDSGGAEIVPVGKLKMTWVG